MKKMVLEDNVLNITRSGKHYKPSFLEKDHLGRDLGEGSKPMKPKGDKEEEDRVLMQLKKTQAHVSVWGLLMASQKHRKALLDAFNGNEVPIETAPQEVLSYMGLKVRQGLSLLFPMKISLPKELLTLDPCKSPLNAWAPKSQWFLLTMDPP